MSVKALLSVACALWVPLIAQAHSDPDGDIHPDVVVEGGRFALYFSARRDAYAYDDWRMVFSADGKLLQPRHRLLTKRTNGTRGGSIQVETHALPVSDTMHFVLQRFQDGKRTEQPLPLDPVKFPLIRSTTMAGEWVGFTWAANSLALSGPGAGMPKPIQLMFSTAAVTGFTPGKTVLIGEPATIYDFPCASNPVWAARRWWVAWVRKSKTEAERKDPMRAWETMLTSIDPVTSKLEHKRLPGLSHWNTSLSMKTTGGWLCIAWHASADGTYPGAATIITAFEKLPE
jgi:hypothetical protein